MLPVLDRSWGLCGRPWTALGPRDAGLGPLLGGKLGPKSIQNQLKNNPKSDAFCDDFLIDLRV